MEFQLCAVFNFQASVYHFYIQWLKKKKNPNTFHQHLLQWQDLKCTFSTEPKIPYSRASQTLSCLHPSSMWNEVAMRCCLFIYLFIFKHTLPLFLPGLIQLEFVISYVSQNSFWLAAYCWGINNNENMCKSLNACLLFYTTVSLKVYKWRMWKPQKTDLAKRRIYFRHKLLGLRPLSLNNNNF